MKKIVFPLCALILALAFSGCSLKSEPKSETAPEPAAANTDQLQDQTDVPADAVPSQDTSFLDITEQQCANNCTDFSDPQELKYCQNVCGIESQNVKTSAIKLKDCDDIQDDLEKDYCLKDAAIHAKDAKVCDDIFDDTIEKICREKSDSAENGTIDK